MVTETSQSAARFRAVFENAGIGIAIADRFGRLLDTNAALQKMLGYASEELQGKHYSEVTHPDDLEQENTLSRQLLEGTRSELQLEKRYIHRDGHVVWGRMTITLVSEGAHDQDFALVMVEDITASKQFENALQHREEELRAVFQSTLDGVAILEPDAVIVDANSAACELLSCPKDELIGRCVKDFLQMDDFDSEWRRFRQKGSYRGQFRVGSSGKLTEISAAVMTNDRSVVLMRDLTERETLEEQLRQSQKMEAIGRFADAIAHDFNNVLTIIMSYAEFIRDELGGESPVLPALTNLVTAANRGSALVSELMFFSREKSPRATISDLKRTVEDFSPLLSRLLGARIRLTIVHGSNPLPVAVERIRLEQVLMNLAANARDAIPRNGAMVIETAEIDLSSPYAEGFGEAAAGRYALLKVSDDGIGMDAETKSKIFEPFFTTKTPGQGTGLGLATVYGIVKQSGGYIWVQSSPAHGTTFKLLFPLAAGERDRAISRS